MVFTKLYERERVDATARDWPGVSVELFGPTGESPLEVAIALSSTVSYSKKTRNTNNT